MIIEVTELDSSLTTNFINFCCDDLGVYPDLITVEGWDEPFKDGALGLCYEVDAKEDYLIMVSKQDRNITEIYNTIAHEMIHVKQFMTQNLSKNLCQEHKPVYKERWYEVEADQNSFDMVKKYVDILKNIDQNSIIGGNNMLDIIFMNLVFWPLWMGISYMPQMIMQKIIDSY